MLCIKRDDKWEVIAGETVDFKGYYNVLHMELSPYVESKVIQLRAGDVVSTFRVPNRVAVIGQCDGLEGLLELQGIGMLNSELKATLTFYRSIKLGSDTQTEIIMTQNRKAEIHENYALFKWTIAVPMMKRISFSCESIPQHYVRYHLKVL